ncbi:MAG: sigma-54-dependent Fis family transcriptional regulator [Nitrospirae bacterium]|nr:sigma-54-dependent Fis family transcriptional regulator [Nitrospirota bacterium]
MKRILVADDKQSMREWITQALEDKGHEVLVASDGDAAITQAATGVDLVITDLRMPKRDGLEVLKAVKAMAPDTEVIVMTAFGTVENAVEAMRRGAHDYILKPFSIDELEIRVQRALEAGHLSEEVAYFKEREAKRTGTMIGGGPAMRRIHTLIDKVAPAGAPVLVLGETGTGKELVAREIHIRSPRGHGPFIAVNCAALSEGVLESELFGHEKGAYTGAAGARKGRFELADGGTLFLDEIGELSPGIQVKLLRFLQEKEFERVGGSKTLHVDVRIVAATHKDLKAAIAREVFREDLYYRLNVISIELPPLRERVEDVPLLAAHFLAKYGMEMAKPVRLTAEVTDRLTHYHWPGNIRELQNVIERAVVLADGDAISTADLPQELLAGLPPAPHATARAEAPDPLLAGTAADAPTDLTQRLESLEKAIIVEALNKYRWNQTKVAAALNLKRSSLQYKLKKYGLTGDDDEG